MIHLPPLAGAPGASGKSPLECLHDAGRIAVQEAELLIRLGFHGVVLENFGDVPFYKDRVPPETIASMAVIAAAVREAISEPIGINILRNDARAALAVASVSGCEWIRVNVLSGVSATDQGIIEGPAAELLRERDRLAASVGIFADIHVKHAQSLSSVNLGLAVEEAAVRSLADAVIVSGATTGRAIEIEALKEASLVARRLGIPLFIGSGATQETIATLKPWVDGVIVSSALRTGGRAGAPLDSKRIRDFVRAFQKPPQKTVRPPSRKKKTMRSSR